MRTQREIDQAINNFEAEVKRLLSEGHDPKAAVKRAYKKYPVMQLMEPTLRYELVNTFMAGYGDEVPYPSKSISEAMAESWAEDGLNLSKRLYRSSKNIKEEVATVISRALKQNQGVRSMAKSLFAGYGDGGVIPEADLPKFIKDLQKIPFMVDNTPKSQAAKREIIRNVKRQVSKLTTPGVRAAYNHLIDAVDQGNEARLENAIDVAIQEKTRYNAERIARTENARAYADGQMSRYMNDPDIVAFKWKLSSRHPRFDICDFYANADLYGLGQGVYPKDKFPRLPAHPHCMCHIQPMTNLDVDLSQQHSNVDQAGLAYIRSLPKHDQEVLLGVNGRKQVLNGDASWRNHAYNWTSEPFEAREPET